MNPAELLAQIGWTPTALACQDFSVSATRLLVAMVLGGLIGWERERHGRQAGLRTHLLLCVGCTLLMLVSQRLAEMFALGAAEGVRADPGRIAAHAVSGIGFLGAGAILVLGRKVIGLTTAASLWVTAAVGLALGIGFYMPAFTTFVVVMFALLVLRRLEVHVVSQEVAASLELRFCRPVTVLDEVRSALAGRSLDLERYSVTRARDSVTYRLSLQSTAGADRDAVSAELMKTFGEKGLERIEWS